MILATVLLFLPSQKEKEVGSTCGVLSFFWYCSTWGPPIMQHDVPWRGCRCQCGGAGTSLFSQLCNLNPGDSIVYGDLIFFEVFLQACMCVCVFFVFLFIFIRRSFSWASPIQVKVFTKDILPLVVELWWIKIWSRVALSKLQLWQIIRKIWSWGFFYCHLSFVFMPLISGDLRKNLISFSCFSSPWMCYPSLWILPLG